MGGIKLSALNQPKMLEEDFKINLCSLKLIDRNEK